MRKWVTGGRVYADGKFKDADLLLENGRIGAVVCHGTPVSGDEIYDAQAIMLCRDLSISIPMGAAAWM